MSWKAIRYEKSRVPFRDRSRANGTVRSKKTEKLRADDQKMVTRLAEEANEAVTGGALEGIFGSSSAAYALRVALRIKRMKRRDEELLSARESAWGDKARKRRRFHGRNIHHLTPKSREGQLFSGSGTHNLLLMKVPRHDLLHKEFGVRTWEEIILLLTRCVKLAWNASLNTMIDSLVPAPPRKKMCRRTMRRSLRDLQLFGESPG